MTHIRNVAGLFFVCLLLPYSIIYGGQQSGDKHDEVRFFRINPLNSLSLAWVNLSTTYPVQRYTFPNQDGTFADKGSNLYLKGTGHGSISSFVDFNYDLRLNTIEGARFKKGSVFLRYRSIALEIGRNNIWLGHGRHGSLLLSNNAEPYSLVRFRTEKPFRIPYLGKFDYTLFHGWPRNFKIIGHKLCWYPVSWFEFNLKQTIAYSGLYTFGDYLKMFTAREANLREGLGQTDSRAGIEIAIDLGFFVSRQKFIKDAKMYMEYGGEDIYAKWQIGDIKFDKDLWVGPFGFQFLDTALLMGIQLNTSNIEFIVEYAQNYKNQYLFYDPYKGIRPYNKSWYRHKAQAPFQNNEASMGHHMGSSAEMLSVNYSQTFSMFSKSIIVSRRHRWHIKEGVSYERLKAGTPERQDSITGILQYHHERYILSALLIYNVYNNVDGDLDLFENRPMAGVKAKEFLAGFLFTIRL